MLDKLDCKECGAPVVKIGMSSTEVEFFPVTDKQGRQHNHDRNSYSASYLCKNNHQTHSGLKPPKCNIPDCDFGDSYTNDVQSLMFRLYRDEQR